MVTTQSFHETKRMTARHDHIDECTECGSDAVFHDPAASGERRQWYDCLNCGTRLMRKWLPPGHDPVDDDGQQEQTSSDRVSDFEMGIEV